MCIPASGRIGANKQRLDSIDILLLSDSVVVVASKSDSCLRRRRRRRGWMACANYYHCDM